MLGFCLISVAGGHDDPPGPARAIAIEGIENAFELAPGLYSGGTPNLEPSFAALKRLGVRTLISVDGAPTDVSTAKRYGMRYIHLPAGYHGLDPQVTRGIAFAVQSLPGPVFIHCHHGKHRGPAAAAIAARCRAHFSAAQATAFLEQAGTSREYPGLFDSVGSFLPPAGADLAAMPPVLKERAETPPFVESMVEIDGLWDELKHLAKPGDPPVEPEPLAPRALLLLEQFQELARRPDTVARPERFRNELQAAADASRRLHEALVRTDSGSLDTRAAVAAAAATVAQSCTSCHALVRNRPRW